MVISYRRRGGGAGVHSKFNLPIRNNDEEAVKKQQPQQLEAVPENLKNIDQKLIDIIQSEVSLNFFLLSFSIIY